MNYTLKADAWFKSSYSNNTGGECVEGARLGTDGMAIRDSKDVPRGTLIIPADSWDRLVQAFMRTS